MNSNLLILGAGQYGTVAKETAEAMGCFGKISFLDDNNECAIGRVKDCKHFNTEYNYALVAVGNPNFRLDFIAKLEVAGYTIPILIHPRAYVSPSAKLERGTIVEPLATVHSNCYIGVGGIVSAGAVVNHNSQLGEGCHVDCNAVVHSGVIVPAKTKLEYGKVYFF